MTSRNSLGSLLLLLSCTESIAFGQVGSLAQPQVRITQPAATSGNVTLAGNVHPFIAQASSSAPADLSTPMQHMVLHLQSNAAQEAALEELIALQNNPASATYHQYLTPQAFATQFGVASSDLATVSAWLQSKGFTIEQVTGGNRSIVFSGTAGQVAAAFQTQMNQYTVDGVQHLANASDPKIPAAFASVVGGVLKLHNFPYQAHVITSADKIPANTVMPGFAPAGARWLVPGDYYTLYDTNPLLSAGIDGTGQSIAVIARSNIYATDIQGFRSLMGLKANNPQVIVTNSDPGIVNDDTVETTLDTEWAGAIAPGANIKVIVSSTGSAGDGIDLSSLYAVTNNVAPILTLSYGACEANMGATELAFYNSLWKQASAQGQTVLVASGDSGAAGCDSASSGTAAYGKGVNGLCSSPYATCVGGTEFVEGSNPGQYWLPSSPGSTIGSAISYLPETVWNESGSSNGVSSLWAGGGGASTVYAKPSWQAGPGVPTDGKRDVPDVALSAASHDGYTVVQGGAIGYIFAVGGTSAATPSFAGMMALVNQKNNSAQGNINAILYPLAAKQATGGAPIFHDITTGNNSVPGLTGYSATPGYDLASGLGSVDANLLATLWTSASSHAPPLSIYANAVSVNLGQTNATAVTTVTTGIKSPVALSVSGLPSGVTATFSSSTIASPGSGTATLQIVASASAVPGVYTLKLTGVAGSQTASSSFELTVATPTFSLSYSGGMYPGVYFGPSSFAPQQIAFQTLPSNGFHSAITFTAAGMPAGMTVAFAPATVAAGGVGNTVATVSVANTIKGGNYSFTVTATGGGLTQTVKYLALVTVQPSCSLSANQMSTSFTSGAGASLNLTCTATAASKTPVSLSVSGAPSGLTATFSSPSITAGGSVALNFNSSTKVQPGTYPLTVTGSEASGATQMFSIYLAISTPTFTLSFNPAAVVAVVGSTTQFTAVVTPDKGFTTPVTVWIGSRPAGVTAAFSATTLANPSSTITLTLDKTTLPGTYPLTIGAIANTGFSRTVASTLTVVAAPTCSLASSSAALALSPGKATTTSLTCAVTKGSFSAPLTLLLAGAPAGVTAQFSPASLTAGSSSVLTLSGGATAVTGNSSLSLTASGSGFTQTISIPLSIAPASFGLSTNAQSLTLKAGGSVQVTVTSKTSGLFNSAIALSAAGLPSGVTATFSNASVAAPGNGTAIMTLTAASTVKAGSYSVGTVASGGGVTNTAPMAVTVTH